MKKIDQRYIWVLTIKYSVLSITLATIIGCFLLGNSNGGTFTEIFFWAFRRSLLLCAVFLIFSYFWSYLTVQNYRYVLEEKEIKRESGVFNKPYVSIPYARIQNVDINRGLISRLFGLSDVLVQTAGNSNPSASAEGLIPGLDEKVAIALRDEISKKINNQSSMGL